MTKTYLFLFLFSLLPAVVCGQAEGNVFEGGARAEYDKAVQLNLSKNWLEAYRSIVSADRQYEACLREKNLRAQDLEPELLTEYCAVKRSKAEIAYMLGIHSDMKTVSEELWEILSQWKGDETSKANLLADMYKMDASRFYLTEKYDSAETALHNVMRESEDWLEYEFDFFYAVRGDFAQLYYKTEQYAEALAQLDTVLMHSKFNSRRVSAEDKIPERRMEVQSGRALCLARLGRYAEAMKEIEPVCAFFKQQNDRRSLAEALRKKAKILMLQYDAKGNFSPEAVSCYRQYLTLSREFIDNHFVNMSESEREQYWMAEQPFVTDCYRLEAKAPDLLYDVALYSKAVLLQLGRDFKEDMTVAEKKKLLSSIRVSWQQVRDKLPADGCAIEFIVYEKKGNTHTGALVITRQSAKPVFVDISSLDGIYSLELEGGLTVKSALTSTAHSDKDALYVSTLLSGRIWNESLLKHIAKCRKVYFSPDGIFHQLAIEYLIPEEVRSKAYYRLTSTRLLTEPRKRLRAEDMLMCGGVDYAAGQTQDAANGNDEQAYAVMSAKGMALPYLSGSKAEVDSIETLRHNPADRVLRADSVTETLLQELLGKYHLILVSTHGYFAEADKAGTDIRPSHTDTQLSQSCLFLSGAETNMRNRRYDASKSDGILSARELAGFDLSEVDLFTLSACQSGLGYVTVDGVFGLQRGLKTAGVKAVIASLWEVDDQATITLMTNLYGNLQKGMPLQDAFSHARQTLATTSVTKRYPRRGLADLLVTKKYDKPHFYDAFILIDGLE